MERVKSERTTPINRDAVLWHNFDPVHERVYAGADGAKCRITIPPEVLALRDMVPTDEEVASGNTFTSRQQKAVELAGQGHVVDTQIDVYAWGPELTYDDRRDYGYTAVPDCMGKLRIYTPPEPQPKEE
jgi:hypothetical protein